MTIRPARPEDALRIATIHVRSWQVAYRGIVPDEFLNALSIEQRVVFWQETLRVSDTSTWVAEEGEIAGWISAGACRDSDKTPSTGEIWAVYLDPAYWRKGVGRALCVSAEGILRSRGFTEVTLWVLKDNQRAIQFYQSIGFVPDRCEERILERGGKALVEVRMQKQLQ